MITASSVKVTVQSVLCVSIFILYPLAVRTLAGEDPDRIITPQRAFASASTKALGNAGVAIPWGVQNGLLNPALVYSYRKDEKNIHGSVSAGYGRDSLFDRNIFPFAVSYSTAEGALGGFYRLMNSADRVVHEGTINLSGQMFEQIDQQGAVDLGLNIRIENTRWTFFDITPIPNIEERRSDGSLLTTSVLDSSAAPSSGQIRENRLILDAGFFQPGIAPNLDFGITMKNVIGYQWTRTRPSVVTEVRDSIAGNTIIRTILRSYENEYAESKGLLDGHYRTVTAGMAYHIRFRGDKLHLLVPADVEAFGLFDKNIENLFSFRGGLELRIIEAYIVRLGYARAPASVPDQLRKIKNTHQLSVGAGLAIDRVKADFYFANNAWGLTATFDY